MRTLDINETIELTDGNFQYVESVNSIIRLRNLADGQYRDLHLAEVTQRMVGLASYAGVSPRSLETMPARQVSATLELNDHVQEILTGTRPGGTEPDPRYDLATTTQNQRIENKIVELRPTNFAVSRRTLMRKIKSFRENGRAGLIDRRSLRQTAPLDHLDPQVQEALCEVLASPSLIAPPAQNRESSSKRECCSSKHWVVTLRRCRQIRPCTDTSTHSLSARTQQEAQKLAALSPTVRPAPSPRAAKTCPAVKCRSTPPPWT